jgi:D-alanyl-D-alanine carboxypeptidase
MTMPVENRNHRPGTLWALVAVFVLAVAACSSPGATITSTTGPTATTTTAVPTTTLTTVGATSYGLGEFPDFPPDSLPVATAMALQSVLDSAVEDGTFGGVTSAVIVANRGSWAGAAGTWDGSAVTPDSRHPTHSSAKTFVAAQVLRLVEDGKLDLNDPASDHLPPELGFFDANQATIRQLLAMRSGIPGLNEEAGFYPAEQAPTVVDVFKQLPESTVAPGTVTEYASTNFVLLGSVIENETGHGLSETLHSDVLAHPGLEGIVHTVEDALASDGWGVETTAASLARWGYDLYGGFVLSDASLSEMTDFQGEWYGLGVMDFSGEYGEFAIGHQGLSSVTTCCSAIILLALPDDGIVVSVQANIEGTRSSNDDVDRLAGKLRDALQG